MAIYRESPARQSVESVIQFREQKLAIRLLFRNRLSIRPKLSGIRTTSIFPKPRNGILPLLSKLRPELLFVLSKYLIYNAPRTFNGNTIYLCNMLRQT